MLIAVAKLGGDEVNIINLHSKVKYFFKMECQAAALLEPAARCRPGFSGTKLVVQVIKKVFKSFLCLKIDLSMTQCREL